MAFKINRKLLPVKAHFFFFFAALGPILPQLNVYGRQLGVSAEAMGFVTAGLPLLWAVAKPAFGYVVDYWPNQRKLVFMLLIIVMTGSYCGLWFIPAPEITENNNTVLENVYQMNDTVYLRKHDTNDEFLEKFKCHWSCSQGKPFQVYLTNTTFVNTIYIDDVNASSCSLLHMDLDSDRDGDITCTPKPGCNLLCFEDDELINSVNITKRDTDDVKYANGEFDNNDSKRFDENFTQNEENVTELDSKSSTRTPIKATTEVYTFTIKYKVVDNDLRLKKNIDDNFAKTLDNTKNMVLSKESIVKNDKATENEVKISIDESKNVINAKDKDVRSKVANVVESINDVNNSGSFYVTGAFWSFVILMCVGTVAFNVANCIGDAVCFDVLGPENGSAYGWQRAWGTAGYGATALLGGWLVDAVSGGGAKDFTPAFVLALLATAADLFSCRRLKLPALSSPDDSGKALREVLKIPRVVVFIIFAVVAGLFDSFIIYYMFWFLEDLAEVTGHNDKIKLIEGLVVAGQSFIGEIVFFALSGRIIKRWGYGATMTLSLSCYGVRMALVSLIHNPWHLIPIESVMQGPTYALCYSTIVGYAARVAPEGYSATVQGVVAGVDDGLGFALGSLVGGQVYARAGGRGAFRVLAAAAAAAALLHALLFALVTRPDKKLPSEPPEEGEKMLPIVHGNAPSAIYRDTVVPLAEGGR